MLSWYKYLSVILVFPTPRFVEWEFLSDCTIIAYFYFLKHFYAQILKHAFILLFNAKMPTFGILKFISRINDFLLYSESEIYTSVGYLNFTCFDQFKCSAESTEMRTYKSFINSYFD